MANHGKLHANRNSDVAQPQPTSDVPACPPAVQAKLCTSKYTNAVVPDTSWKKRFVTISKVQCKPLRISLFFALHQLFSTSSYFLAEFAYKTGAAFDTLLTVKSGKYKNATCQKCNLPKMRKKCGNAKKCQERQRVLKERIMKEVGAGDDTEIKRK